VVKPQPPAKVIEFRPYHCAHPFVLSGYWRDERGVWNSTPPIRCPHGIVGDRLWVRETWMPETEQGIPTGGTIYRASPNSPEPDGDVPLRWRPSIFMPRWASRITLEITGIRVERLQEITGRDVLAEGVDNGKSNPTMGVRWENMQRMAFEQVWNAINAKRGYGWAVNPWVWVIAFRRV